MKLTLATTQEENNGETKYIYHNESGQWLHLISTKQAFTWKIQCCFDKTTKFANKVCNAFVKRGIKQHDFKGGFNEAISILEVI